MTSANAELGRLNTELLITNRRLATGARYFEAITRFEQELSDWSDPSAVMIALVSAAATALQRPRVAAFGLRDNASAVDVSWIGRTPEERGHVTQVVPPELTAWIAEATEQLDALIRPAPRAVRSLLAPALNLSDRGTPWLLPICHGSEIAGGLGYVSEADERARLEDEADKLRSFLACLGRALGRANAQAAARRLSEDLAETNRRLQRMQVELLRSRTLSMIAEMAAGAGHELNSPLTVISGRAQMLAATLRDPEAIRALKTISDKAHECSGIVSELLVFARPRPPKLAPVDLAEVLAEVRTEWLEHSGLTPTQLRFEPEPLARPSEGADLRQTATVLVDRDQIKEVFRELLSNATDALGDDGGNIVLRCQVAHQEDTLEVIVEDTGRGMSPAILQRAFDPFFSHRAAGRRRGLGLPRAYRIIEAHGGRIWLESRLDEGTTAHVLLPRGESEN